MKKIITAENSGQRVDLFLKEEFFSISRQEIIYNIKEVNILVNGKKVKPSYVLKENDELKIILEKKSAEIIPNKNISVEVIFENENFLAVNKPTGLIVHPISMKDKNTLANWLVAKYPKIKNVHDESTGAEFRPGIVQRLDKETSGVMVIAKNQKTFEELKNIFQNRKAQKKYLALVYGKLKNNKGLIDKPIAKAKSNKKQVIANENREGAKEAVTEYKVVKEFKDYSLVEARPRTGRMHQVRLHLFSIGHPVVGDKKYKATRNKRQATSMRHLLHAKNLKFELFGDKYELEAPIPKDFEDFLNEIS